MSNSNDGHLYQPVVIYNKQIRISFHKENLAYPIYSPIVFSEPAQATEYLSIFIKNLVESGDLPKDAILDKHKINESVIKSAIQEIIVGKIEREEEET